MRDAYRNLPEELKDNSDISEGIRYQQKRMREAKEKKRNNMLFFVGILVIIFSLIGFIGVVWTGVSYINEKKEEKEQALYNSYSSFLLAVAAVDPEPFDDVTAAPMEELVEIAVWNIIGSDLDPNKYEYSSDSLEIPAAEVEKAFNMYFSSQVKISHCTVTGYGYEFRYNAEKNVYFVPLTTIEPVYTPKIKDIQSSGGATVITCGLINANAWLQDAVTGDISAPDPDKYIKVTLREYEGHSYISSIQTSSLPGTAIVDIFTTAPAETAENESAEEESAEDETEDKESEAESETEEE